MQLSLFNDYGGVYFSFIHSWLVISISSALFSLIFQLLDPCGIPDESYQS
jgi:hypothetical protein